MKRNCWTCIYDDGHGGCSAVSLRPDVPRSPIEDWIDNVPGQWSECMPPKDADGCPGYEQRQPRKAKK